MKFQLLLIATLFTALLNAQDTASVYWELSLGSKTNFETAGALVGVKQSYTDQLKIYGYGGVYLSQQSYASGGSVGYWPNETVENSDRYFEFQAYPRNGVSFQLSKVSMRIGGGGSNKFMVSVFYSTDNFESRTALIESKVLPLEDLMDMNFNLNADNIIVDNQQPVSVRIYPWLFGGMDGDAYLNIRDFEIMGVTTGDVIPDLPIIETVGIDKISTQSVLFKGNSIDDGGVTLDSLGVVYNTSANPDITNSVALVEGKKGAYQVKVEGLTANTTYYLKAFALNAAGVIYGEEVEFTTLEKLSVPSVTTNNVSYIKPTSAVAYGNVSFDGGLDVTLTGFCYSKQVSPTVSDFVVNEGKGLGNFNALIDSIEDGQNYYVRAFAENAEGFGYGDQIEFTTLNTEPDIYYTVDKSGNGDYTTLQAAFNAVPTNYNGKITVFVKNGIYDEKVFLEIGKINVHLLGENRDSTIIRWDDYSGKIVDGIELGTYTSQTIAIDADDFIAQDITFQNTYNGSQAVALRVKGDRMIFNHCNLLGFQDTYYTQGRGRVYHEDCYIEGTVDFIFGSSVILFKNCLINSKRNSPVTAANTEEGFKFGYVFDSCTLIADEDITKSSLGRPWRPYANTVFMNSELGAHIIPGGWIEWRGNNNHLTAYYAEYNNSGPGYVPESRVEWAHILSNNEAAEYTMENIFSKETSNPDYAYDWMPIFVPMPVDPVDTTTQAVKYQNRNDLVKIYPNPVKGTAIFECNLNQESIVNIIVYSIDGRLVQQLVNKTLAKSENKISWNTSNIKGGTYICKITIDNEKLSKLLIVE